jgi:hypothetical protein
MHTSKTQDDILDEALVWGFLSDHPQHAMVPGLSKTPQEKSRTERNPN